MNWSAFLATLYGQYVMILIGVFAVVAVLIIPAYFIAQRPAKGTTEWMRRIDAVKFTPLKANKFAWIDLAWMSLAGFCAAMLRLTAYLLGYFRYRQMHLLPNAIQTILLYRMLPSAVLAVAFYLLLRSMFDQTLPVVCAAALGGLMHNGSLLAAALIVASLYFLWQWTAADANAKLLPRMLYLLASLMLYGFALLRYWPVIWLAPIYAAAYIYAQIYRWRNTTLPNRGISLGVSLLLLFFMAVGAVLCVWIYYCYYTGQLDQVLNLRKFLEVLPAKMLSRLNYLVVPFYWFASIYVEDAFMFILGCCAIIPILHGLFARRDSRCIVLVAMAVPFALMWTCGSLYLLTPLLIMATAWVLNTLTERKQFALCTAFSVVAAIAYMTENFI